VKNEKRLEETNLTKINIPELLAPAGNMESLYIAVAAGCDAVYFGGAGFNARANAGNFTAEDMEKAIDYCHLRGVKCYITLNTLVKGAEMHEFLTFAQRLYNAGADAFIVQDIGAAMLLRKNFPNIRLHASTQMTIHSQQDAEFLVKNGFDRVVMARELSLKQIIPITESGVEVECFVHGALCFCYSGQCLMSSLLGGRSGNRGRCAQPCRLKYSLEINDDLAARGYLLSPKDISYIEQLPQLIGAGAASFKIEGRMKSPEYVGLVTQIFRKHIDGYMENPNKYRVSDDDKSALLQIFNRGGSFSPGYLDGNRGRDMLSSRVKNSGVRIGEVVKFADGRCTVRTSKSLVPGDGIEIVTRHGSVGTGISREVLVPNGETSDAIVVIEGEIFPGDVVYKTYDKKLMDDSRAIAHNKRKIDVCGTFKAAAGKPSELTLSYEGLTVNVVGGLVEHAKNVPIDVDEVSARLSKLGDTTFKMKKIEVDIEGDIYIPVGELNGLRRMAADVLGEKIIANSKRESERPYVPVVKHVTAQETHKLLTVSVQNKQQFDAVCAKPYVHRVYVELPAMLTELNYFPENSNRAEVFAALPRISTNRLDEVFEQLENSDVDGYLVRTYGQFEMVRATDKKIAMDHSFNVLNQAGLEFWKDKSCSVALSAELNFNEINRFANDQSEIVIYGKMPLMVSALCPIGAFGQCQNTAVITDRKGEKFTLLADCDNCTCTILNSVPTFLANNIYDVPESSAGLCRLSFTDEEPIDVAIVLQTHYDVLAGEPYVPLGIDGFTKGHFYKGL